MSELRQTSVPTPALNEALAPTDDQELMSLLQQLLAGMEKSIRGKADVIRMLLVGSLAGGSVLLEDVPGVGKTTLAKSFASLVDMSFNRVQGTPDLLPADIFGYSTLNPQQGTFQFRPGPVFCNLLLVDEINRTSPRTQAALLEAMAEEQVTVEGVRRPLPQPFIVIATQNPLGYQGTFPLPEAQLDRFLFQLHMDYPDHEDEIDILYLPQAHADPEFQPLISCQQFLEMRDRAAHVSVQRDIASYMVQLAEATRNAPEIALGCSPRGTQMLFRASQANAYLDGRPFVLPDDVRAVALFLLPHRMVFRDQRLSSADKRQLTESLLNSVAVPS